MYRDSANPRTLGLTLGLGAAASARTRGCARRARFGPFAFATLAPGLLGCATILSGSSQEVSFRASARPDPMQGTVMPASPASAQADVHAADVHAADVHAADVHATVEVRDKEETVARGTTPFRTALARKHSYTAVIRAPGFEEVSVALDRRFNLWMLGNLACGGLVGGVVDWLTGAMWRLAPDEVAVELARVGPARVLDGQASDVEAQPSAWVAVFTALDARGELRTLSVPLRPRP